MTLEQHRPARTLITGWFAGAVSDVEAKYPRGRAKKGNGEAEEKVEVNGESRLVTLSVITSIS
jgi:hypothetical protein